MFNKSVQRTDRCPFYFVQGYWLLLRLIKAHSNDSILTSVYMRIRTSRLELVLQSAELIRMEIGNPASLGQALDAVVPAAWPPESVRDVLEFFKQELEENPNTGGWAGYYWLSTKENAGQRILIDSGGFVAVQR